MIPKGPYDPRAYGARCDECPLRGRTVVPPEGAQRPLLVLIGEGPGQHEVDKRRPFIGPSGRKLVELLRDAGMQALGRPVEKKEVWITNAVLCRAEVPGLKGKQRFALKEFMAWLRRDNQRLRKEAKEKGEEASQHESPFDCCAPRLQWELGQAEQRAREDGQPNGAIVVPLGNYALKAVLGKWGIKKWRGSVADPEDPLLKAQRPWAVAEEEEPEVQLDVKSER